jgi:hypothetical protein
VSKLIKLPDVGVHVKAVVLLGVAGEVVMQLPVGKVMMPGDSITIKLPTEAEVVE